jgi:hypothetical protein
MYFSPVPCYFIFPGSNYLPQQYVLRHTPSTFLPTTGDITVLYISLPGCSPPPTAKTVKILLIYMHTWLRGERSKNQQKQAVYSSTSWGWKQYIPPKHQAISKLHINTTQKTTFFMLFTRKYRALNIIKLHDCWVFGLCPLSGILKNVKEYVWETWCFILRWRGGRQLLCWVQQKELTSISS